MKLLSCLLGGAGRAGSPLEGTGTVDTRSSVEIEAQHIVGGVIQPAIEHKASKCCQEADEQKIQRLEAEVNQLR